MFVSWSAADVYDLLHVRRNPKSALGSEEKEHILISVFMSSPYHVWTNSSRLFPFWYQLPKTTVGDSKASMCLWDASQEITMENYPQSLWASSEEAARVELRLLLVAHDGAFSAAFWPECLTAQGPGAGLLQDSNTCRSDEINSWSHLNACCGFKKGFRFVREEPFSRCEVQDRDLSWICTRSTFQHRQHFQKLTGVLISCWNVSSSLTIQTSSTVKPRQFQTDNHHFENKAELMAARWDRFHSNIRQASH